MNSSERRGISALISLGLFLMALLPRAIGLGVFVTADEAKWVYRSQELRRAIDPLGLVGGGKGSQANGAG